MACKACVLEGLDWSPQRRMKQFARAGSGANCSVQGVRGPGPEPERAAGPLVGSFSLHPRPVGRELRTPQGSDKPGQLGWDQPEQFELESQFWAHGAKLGLAV